jgi:hypothetical protein
MIYTWWNYHYRKDLIDVEKGQQIILNKAYEFSEYNPTDLLIELIENENFGENINKIYENIVKDLKKR